MVPIAIIDTETTGLFPHRHDRVIEVAVVVMQPDGEIMREFVTLVNPGRDVGRTDIHGITAEDLQNAPTFADVAGVLTEILDGCVAIAGHNVRFDHGFVAHEFGRIGHPFPEVPSLCTMELAGGGRLADCCEAYGVDFDGQAHAALNDARATAKLLAILLSEIGVSNEVCDLPPIAWPQVARAKVSLLTRDETRRRQSEPPSYLERLLARTHSISPQDADDSTAFAYAALLDRILEDRRVDESEGESLIEVADRWGIDPERVRRLHANYLRQLAFVALSDGVVSESERRDLLHVARLLGVGQAELEQMLAEASMKMAEVRTACRSTAASSTFTELTGKRVCFTGECICRLHGMAITRDLAGELAVRKGLVVCPSVTKKLDLLVVADPHSQSGKAKKARDYGVRIVHEPVFWKTLGVEVD